MELEVLCRRHKNQLLSSIKSNVHKSPSSGVTRRSSIFGNKSVQAKADDLKSKLFAAGHSETDVAEILFAIAVGISAEYSQGELTILFCLMYIWMLFF